MPPKTVLWDFNVLTNDIALDSDKLSITLTNPAATKLTMKILQSNGIKSSIRFKEKHESLRSSLSDVLNRVFGRTRDFLWKYSVIPDSQPITKNFILVTRPFGCNLIDLGEQDIKSISIKDLPGNSGIAIQNDRLFTLTRGPRGNLLVEEIKSDDHQFKTLHKMCKSQAEKIKQEPLTSNSIDPEPLALVEALTGKPLQVTPQGLDYLFEPLLRTTLLKDIYKGIRRTRGVSWVDKNDYKCQFVHYQLNHLDSITTWQNDLSNQSAHKEPQGTTQRKILLGIKYLILNNTWDTGLGGVRVTDPTTNKTTVIPAGMSRILNIINDDKINGWDKKINFITDEMNKTEKKSTFMRQKSTMTFYKGVLQQLKNESLWGTPSAKSAVSSPSQQAATTHHGDNAFDLLLNEIPMHDVFSNLSTATEKQDFVNHILNHLDQVYTQQEKHLRLQGVNFAFNPTPNERAQDIETERLTELFLHTLQSILHKTIPKSEQTKKINNIINKSNSNRTWSERFELIKAEFNSPSPTTNRPR